MLDSANEFIIMLGDYSFQPFRPNPYHNFNELPPFRTSLSSIFKRNEQFEEGYQACRKTHFFKKKFSIHLAF